MAGRDGPVAPRRRLATGLAVAGAVWALVTLPLVAQGWSWPAVDALAAAAPYRWVAGWVGDPYVVVGALGGLSFLAVGVALLVGLRPARWSGRLLVLVVGMLALGYYPHGCLVTFGAAVAVLVHRASHGPRTREAGPPPPGPDRPLEEPTVRRG